MATPANWSRTMAIAVTEIAAPANPWRTRTPAKISTVGASEQATDASACTPRPTINGRRRPNASDTGPITSCAVASPRSMPVSVSWTWDSEAENSSVI